MDNTALKGQIDAQITNQTGSSSVTRSAVGGNLKAVVDYVDQEVVLKVKKRTLTSAEILALFTTPLEMIPGVAGKAFIVANIYTNTIPVSTSYSVASNFSLYLFGGIGIGNFSPGLANFSGGESISVFTSTVGNGGYTRDGVSVFLKANGSNPTGGDHTLDVYISYYEITL